MNWKFFIGSCILVAGLLLKAGAPIVPIIAGMAIAGVISWRLQRRTQGTRRSPQ